jgi:two-component system chemotaxis response regulator CheY
MLNVLVVDDSLIIRNTLKKQFEELGYKVVGLASSGKEAVDMYSVYKPDIVTMDITMPLMSGVEALQRIKLDFPDANVIMVTSHGEEKLVMDAISSGAKGYILKPITHGKLTSALMRVFPDISKKSA